jgi:hypothetical protein
VADAEVLPLELEGADTLRDALADVVGWVATVEDIGPEHIPDNELRHLVTRGADLKVFLPETEGLQTKLANKLQAQLLDAEIEKARNAPTSLVELESLHARAVAVGSTTDAFKRFSGVVQAASQWQKRAYDALKIE